MRLFLEKKIKEIFGGKIKVLISGGAALSPSTGFFFNMVGLKLLQGYGQTEAAPLISCNYIHNNNPKTVGFPVKNVAVKISSENEILVKNRNVMLGYWYNKRLTQQTIIDGWLYTGDLGYFDSIGRLIINGRKKELIVTSGGDNISPQKIEDMLKEYLEIEQAVIFGDSKPYLVALVVLSKDFEGVNVNNIIRSINKKLNNVEKIRKFLLVSKPFSYDDGLLTQTLKLKKKKFINFIRKEIDRMYN